MSIHGIRPLGDADLQALKQLLQQRFLALSAGWFVESAVRIASVMAAPSARWATISDEGSAELRCVPLGGGASMALQSHTLHSVGELSLAGHGRVSPPALKALFSDMGQRAWAAILGAAVGLPEPGEMKEESVPSVTPGLAGAGVVLELELSGQSAQVFYPRPLIDPLLPPTAKGPRPLPAARLPAQWGLHKHPVRVRSRPFEVAVNDLTNLMPGDVLVLDQPLDTSFSFEVEGVDDIQLDAYLGRRGSAMAVEVFAKR